MKDIDELKRKWQDITPPQKPAEYEKACNIPSTGKAPRSIKERLMSRLRRMYLAIVGGLMLLPSLGHEFDPPVAFQAFYIVYFLLGAVFNLIQISSLRKADFATMTTIDAIEFVTRFTRRRKQFRLTLIICGAILLTSFFLMALHLDDPWLLAGMAFGAASGLIIGLHINRRFNADLRLLRSYLGEE